MVAQKDDLSVIQQQVIKWTYLLMFLSIIVSFFISNKQTVMSVVLGTAVSLLFFNNKFSAIKKAKDSNKLPVSQSFQTLFHYSLLFIMLAVVNFYTELNVWVVLFYSFLANFLLIIYGLGFLPKINRGK